MLREYFTQDLYISLIIGCFVIVVTARQLFATRFIDFLAVIWNDRYIKIYAKEQRKIDVFTGLLFLNFIVTLGIFIFLSYSHLKDSNVFDNNYLLLILFSVIAITLIVKALIERLVAHFFEFSEFAKIYLFQKSTYKNISGLLLLLTNILLLFSKLDKKLVLYSTITILLLINISGFLRFLKLYQKAVISNFFYFLLYLCALEIGPYVILYKVIKDYFG
ncbi:hypothetical protein BTO05_10375 [Winogradskyella sp. PC-19]|uniref:DUF4271 domain-containing protein n=1 Tax=unclassified Winogradskyella TaxID=2615021 RepID=UPI000B3C7425|nr:MULTISPECIES: DUF4271 domain-containing protein [unclassified Winogradskyella]ARV10020.1 hypothetical protein BTO05_10375 [Winogradskyella sp. PC-19]RZN80328.1 MAG: DUF4271 domain-containing protein [Winogradskyella sp.]